MKLKILEATSMLFLLGKGVKFSVLQSYMYFLMNFNSFANLKQKILQS